MTDHLVVQIFLHWGLGIALILGWLAWALVVGLAGAMSDAPHDNSSVSQSALIGFAIAVVGVLVLIFL